MSFLTSELLTGTDWKGLERAVGRLLSHCGWSSVRIIGRRGDGGADVIATRRLKGINKVFVTQVKAISGSSYASTSAIQEVLEASSIYKSDVSIVATNGDFTGSAVKRKDELNESGFEIHLWNGATLQALLEKWPEFHHERRNLFEFQNSIVTKCIDNFKNGSKSCHFIVATGLGKTVIASEIAVKLSECGLKKILVLCHSQDLALQLEKSFWNQLPKSMPTYIFFEGRPPKPMDGINFGLYQTLSSYVDGLNEDAYDLIIVDEAHHAPAEGFLKCLRKLKPKYLIGMTATPWRGDGLRLEDIFGPAIDRVSLVDGMAMGHLANVEYRIYCDNIQWSEIPKLTGNKFTVKDLNKRLFLPQRDEAIAKAFKDVAKEVGSPRAIIFCSSIEHCNRFAELFSASTGFPCRALSGLNRVDRDRTLMEFSANRISAVTAVDLLNEGIDVPDVNILVFLRSTHSRRIFVQQLGRGLRLPYNQKKTLKVLDFVTDIRRIAEVVSMDKEAREDIKGYHNLNLKNGFVKFMSEGDNSFVKEWLEDVADLAESDDEHILTFPSNEGAL